MIVPRGKKLLYRQRLARSLVLSAMPGMVAAGETVIKLVCPVLEEPVTEDRTVG